MGTEFRGTRALFFMFSCALFLTKYLRVGHPFILWHRENLSPFCDFFFFFFSLDEGDLK